MSGLNNIRAICFFSIVFMFGVAENSLADCTGSSPVWTSTDCSDAEISTCIGLAAPGDTINVPAGTCTWTTAVIIPTNKTIKLIGAGYENTIINSLSTAVLMQSDNSRLSGFRFNRATGGDTTPIIDVKGRGWRIDHNYIDDIDYLTANHWVSGVSANALNMTVRPQGVIDSNIFNHTKIVIAGSTILAKDNGFWADASVVGTGDTVYIEDNYIDRGDISSVNTDSNYAASWVLRYNTILGGSGSMAHSLQGAAIRGTKSWELYGNSYQFRTTNAYNMAFLRGGTGMMFGNLVTGPRISAYQITFDNVRSFSCPGCGDNPPPATDDSGMCDGTSLWDGNILANGHPCRDQIGRGPDIGTDSSIIGKATSSSPAYLWSNKRNTGADVLVSIGNGTDAWILSDEDYYDYNSSFDGTSGTGCGILNSRPATCVTGVGYWATNQSCSDLTGMIGSNPTTPIVGTLYKCTSPNTWTAYYEPYTYPHPLRSESFSDTTAPQSPHGLTVY